MDLKDVVSISGLGGLHKIIGRRSTGLIVETIDAQKKRFPTTLSQKVSVLEDISMYTTDGESRLRDVLLSLNEKEAAGLAIPDKKADDAAFRAFMKEILPNFDVERVYVSDIRKLANWYAMLKPELDFEAMKNAGKEEAAEAVAESTEETKKETKKAAAKTTKPKAVEKKVAAPRAANVKSQNNAPRKTGGG